MLDNRKMFRAKEETKEVQGKARAARERNLVISICNILPLFVAVSVCQFALAPKPQFADAAQTSSFWKFATTRLTSHTFRNFYC